jgi:hypothetical protein
MLTLLSPIGLWALAALSLPLALHLWRRPPRVVRLGSLRFLARLTRRRATNLRWHERRLLAVRLLLLALLALMLARPHWRPASWDLPQHWVLLDPVADLAGESLARLRAVQGAGYETHFLAPGFPQRRDATAGFRSAPDLWSLLREADAGLPAGSSLAVFTPGRLSSLRGERPALARCRVDWVITPDVQNTLPAPEPRLPAPPLAVLILHDASRVEDARYLAAAVRAVAQVSGREMTLSDKDAAEQGTDATHADWIFWLAARPAPEPLAAAAPNLVTAAEDAPPGAVDTPPGWIVPQPGAPGVEALTDSIRLWRRVPSSANPQEAILWTDSFGRPLLTRSSDGAHQRWRFSSRFHPDWTDLPRTTALPAWLRAVLLPETNAPLFADPVRDLRRADPVQLPAATAASTTSAVTLPLRRDTPGLQGWCWLFAALLFGLERLLSHRRGAAGPLQTDSHVTRPEPALAR